MNRHRTEIDRQMNRQTERTERDRQINRQTKNGKRLTDEQTDRYIHLDR